MKPGLVRDVTQQEIETYRSDGVVRLRGILAEPWVAALGPAIDAAVYQHWDEGTPCYDLSAQVELLRAAGEPVLSDARADAIEKPGKYLTIIGAWTVTPELRRFALESPLGYIAGRLFGARRVCFYDDQTLVKEPGARPYTAFHTDEPYYHLRGDQVCGMWVSPDVVDVESGAMQYVRGSHRWPSFFKPNGFANQTPLDAYGLAEADEQQIPLPDIEGEREKYDIVTHPSEPGDVIVHHSRLVHGSGPNYSSDRRRRAVSLRYAGDDVRYWFHRSAPPQPHHVHSLRDGDPIECAQFPLVWDADVSSTAPLTS